MARPPVTRRLVRVLALALLPATVPGQPPEAAVATAPAAPQLWETRTLQGKEYVSARDIAKRFNLTAAWEKADLTMNLSDASGVRLSFESHRRDFHFDRLRVFLGEPALAEWDTIWISKLDVIKIIHPLLRPVDHLVLLPAAAPRTIVIDAGHGGSDPGKENNLVRLNEKTATLDVALRLRKILEARGWRVLLTRPDDRELSSVKVVDLKRRADVANNAHADLFLSIHFNSVEKDTDRVSGVETYVMTPQFMLSTADERKDDKTDMAFPGNRLDYANLLFGEQLHRAILAALHSSDRGFKHGRLEVLRLVECPGALVECAYLSNITDARRVATPEYRERIAQALATGVENYATVLAALHPAKPVRLPPTRPTAPAR